MKRNKFAGIDRGENWTWEKWGGYGKVFYAGFFEVWLNTKHIILSLTENWFKKVTEVAAVWHLAFNHNYYNFPRETDSEENASFSDGQIKKPVFPLHKQNIFIAKEYLTRNTVLVSVSRKRTNYKKLFAALQA